MQNKPLRQAKTIENVFNSAYWHLAQQDYTIDEIRTKLTRKTENVEWVETVIENFITNGYLKSNFDFAVRYCELAFSREIGRNAIKRKLQLRGISEADVESALEQVMDEQNINLLAMATSRLLNKYENFANTDKEKVYSQMMTKGFTRAETEHALSQHPQRETLRSKLAIKAEKSDLKTEIIKLFKKGKGKNFILQDLKQRLIDVSDFDDAVYQLALNDEVDFYQSCKAELDKKRFDLSDYKEKSKAYAYLSRKGFDSDEIKSAMTLDE
ncbi:RecX family transcriptional regulator [Thalassotalea sp. PLHSN55]|uniref:RecX family transcriptional regulator n=1 Tax=Thalassotalea sp. PLHSN55 TaxID=3435888 RepID=UPI003F8729FB